MKLENMIGQYGKLETEKSLIFSIRADLDYEAEELYI
jgi:hypothetical protein